MVATSPKINKISQMRFIFSPEYREGIINGIEEALFLQQELLKDQQEDGEEIYHEILDEVRDVVPDMNYYEAHIDIICGIVFAAITKSTIHTLQKISHLKKIQDFLCSSVSDQNLKDDIDASVRYEVLKRDHFRCVYCGENPCNDPRLTLVAIPINRLTKWNKNNISTYQTLCNYCNAGKGNNTY